MSKHTIPHISQINGQPVLMVGDKPFILLAGEVHNSDSSSPAYMEKIWAIADELGMNTLLLPVTWEMIEPEEGHFDFSVPKALIDQARERDMHIVFLWFGSWKNAECMYAPAYVKTDLVRFPRAQIEKGKNKAGREISPAIPVKAPYTTLSYLGEETMKADGSSGTTTENGRRWLRCRWRMRPACSAQRGRSPMLPMRFFLRRFLQILPPICAATPEL